MRKILHLIWALAVTTLVTSAFALDVSIPDPGLAAAIRGALQKPSGPLTDQDLLTLTNLDASNRNITNMEGLQLARNLIFLNLQRNHLTNFSFPSELTNLTFLDLSFNALTNCSFPNTPARMNTLNLADNRLTNFTFSASLNGLISLNIEDNGFSTFTLPPNLTRMVFLDVGFNSLTNCSLPTGLTNLSTFIIAANLLTNFTLPTGLTRLATLDLHINSLTNFALPAGLTALTNLNLSENELTGFTLPAGTTNLANLNLFFNQLSNLPLPADLRNLITLNLNNNQFTNLNLPSNLIRLQDLRLRENQLTSFFLPTDMTALAHFDIGENQLISFTLPPGLHHLATLRISSNKNLTSLVLPVGMTNLTGIFLRFNQLTNLTLPPDLIQLTSLDVVGNQLTSLALPVGLTNLTELFLSGNELTTLTLPPDMTLLTSLVLDGNPLTTLVLSQPLATSTNLAATITSLQDQGVSVSTFTLVAQLVSPRQPADGAFEFALTGPPGVYSILSSTNLSAWSNLGALTNNLGTARFADVTSVLSRHKFYLAQLQSPPANMVFVPPNTFTLGSPANEIGRSSDESPQTTVTLSRGFWISKFLVTQRDYLAVIGSNPSGFPGDLNRPVESVTWLDATNYCAKLTQQDLTAGRIPPGTHYRLPTEAEWECAARAGTLTRFNYGDDPATSSLTNHAWFGANGGVTTKPVAQKEPNAWGLYDMEGNVWEWCQDWYGSYPGGSITDPQGPASNPTGVKVIRGGAWEAFPSDCRSARRSTEGVSPFISDFIIGFRVVLVAEP